MGSHFQVGWLTSGLGRRANSGARPPKPTGVGHGQVADQQGDACGHYRGYRRHHRFFAVEALRGDTFTVYLGRQVQDKWLATCQKDVGLDLPAVMRFADWAGKAATGDLGQSITRKKSVNELIGYRLRNTAILGLAACLVGIPLAILLGILAALWRARPFDVDASSLAIVLMTLPAFVTGSVLLELFATKLKWLPGIVVVSATLPVSALSGGSALPVIVMAPIMAAHIQRMTRSSVIDVVGTD